VTLCRIGDWYVIKNYTYIQVYGVIKAPHVPPKYVLVHMVLSEIAYQAHLHGVGAYLDRKKRDLWPNLPITMGAYSFNITPEAEKLVEDLKLFIWEKCSLEGMILK